MAVAVTVWTCKQRLGGLSVEKTGAKKAAQAAQKERLLSGAEPETRRRRKADRASS